MKDIVSIFGICMILFIIALIIFGLLSSLQEKREKECEQKGGVYVQRVGCVKSSFFVK